MNVKNTFKDLIKWGSENNENKKKAIQGAIGIIAILNQTDHKLTDKELDKISGGAAGLYNPLSLT